MLHDDYTAAAALLQNDPQEGLRRLMELFGGPVHAICTAILRGHAEDADEAAADTFVRLWRNASSLPAGTALRGYVVRTARSCAIDRYRALTRRGVLFPLDGREEDMDFAVELESLLETRELAGMILALPPPDGSTCPTYTSEAPRPTRSGWSRPTGPSRRSRPTTSISTPMEA